MKGKKIIIIPYLIGDNIEDADFLVEGILEEMIDLLPTRVGLATGSRSTSLYLKSNPRPVNEIKEQFEADYILEGTIRKRGTESVITTRLFDASNETLVFSSKKAFDSDRWVSIIDELVLDINHQLNGKVLAREVRGDDKSKEREYYQKGLYHWHRYSMEEMILSIAYYKKAIKENPNFALAYAGMADSYCVIGVMGYDTPSVAYEHAKKAVKKALELNNKRSETYTAAALVNLFCDLDLVQAKINLDVAYRFNNNSAKIHHALSMYHIHNNELNLAVKHSLEAIKLEPLFIPHYAMLARLGLYERKYDLALDYVNAALNLDKDAVPLYEVRGLASLFLGNTESAIEDFKYCIANDSVHPSYIANLSYAYAKVGFFSESREMEEQLKGLNINKSTGLYDYALSIVKLGQSDYDTFFVHLKKAIDFKLGLIMGQLRCNPFFSEVQRDTRFQEILIESGMNAIDEEMKERFPSSVFQITTNTKETLSIDPQDISFIKAHDNYSVIHWQNGGVLQKKILRVTLKELEEQFVGFPYIVRCHRSYLINVNEPFNVVGNTRAAFFEAPFLPIRIPISRGRVNLFKKEHVEV